MNGPGIQPTAGLAAPSPSGLARRVPSRSTRVTAMVAVILALSLVDLLLTLTYVLHIGLIEDNPVARGVMQTGGPGLLIFWKLLSVGFAGGVLLRFRTRGTAEAAAALCACVMVWLTARWVGYIDASAGLTGAIDQMDHVSQGNWVTLVEVEPE